MCKSFNQNSNSKDFSIPLLCIRNQVENVYLAHLWDTWTFSRIERPLTTSFRENFRSRKHDGRQSISLTFNRLHHNYYLLPYNSFIEPINFWSMKDVRFCTLDVVFQARKARRDVKFRRLYKKKRSSDPCNSCTFSYMWEQYAYIRERVVENA